MLSKMNIIKMSSVLPGHGNTQLWSVSPT